MAGSEEVDLVTWLFAQWWIYLIISQVTVAIVVYLYLICGYNKEVRRSEPLDYKPSLPGKKKPAKIHNKVDVLVVDDNPAIRPKGSDGRLSIFEKLPHSEINPFYNQSWSFTQYEAIKTAFMFVTFFPFRFILFLINFLALAFTCKLLTCGLKGSVDGPIPGCRRCLIGCFTRFYLRVALFILGYYWISTKGKKAKTAEAAIIVANHICAIETFYLGLVYLPSAVANGANFQGCLMQGIARALRLLTFDRKDPNARAEVKRKMAARAKECSEKPGECPPVLIFPEGTTHGQTCVLNFKAGAFSPGVPVQPVLVKMPWSHFDPCWVYCGPDIVMLLSRLMCQFYNTISLEFLPVYTPSEVEQKNPFIYAANVRKVMAERLDLPMTFHSVDDVMLQNKAKRALHSNSVKFIVDGGIAHIKDFFQLSGKDVEQHFQDFVKMDKNRNGKISLDEFIAGFTSVVGHELTADQTAQLTETFELMDDSHDGYLDFKEYLLGLALSKDDKASRKEIVQLLFNAFDRTGSGHIGKSDCLALLTRVFPEMTEQKIDEMYTDVFTGTQDIASKDEVQTDNQSPRNSSVKQVEVKISAQDDNDNDNDNDNDDDDDDDDEKKALDDGSGGDEANEANESGGLLANASSAPKPSGEAGANEPTITFEQFEAYATKHPELCALFRKNMFHSLPSPKNEQKRKPKKK